jgi:hypothetical protein
VNSYWEPQCTKSGEHFDCRECEVKANTASIKQCEERDHVVTQCKDTNPLCSCQSAKTPSEVLDCLDRAEIWADNLNYADHYSPPVEEQCFGGISVFNGAVTPGYLDKFTTDGKFRGHVGNEDKDCKAALKTSSDLLGKCLTSQAAWQDGFCDFVIDAHQVCVKFDDDYAKAVEDYRGIEARITGEEQSRNKELCQAAKKIKCYMRVIAGDDGFDIARCTAFEPACDHLEVVKPPVQAATPCRETDFYLKSVDDGRPSEPAWVKAYYGTADAAACQYKVTFTAGFTASYTCPHLPAVDGPGGP